jgi:putative ABC transport system permease protein
MNTVIRLAQKELLHRKVSFLLSVCAVTAAVGLCVALTQTEEASQRETRRITRDIGFNLRIVPKATDMNHFYLHGFSEHSMPEKTIDLLAQVKDFSYNHLVATLQQKFPLNGEEVLLLGISGERAPPGKKKPAMIYSVDAGTLHVGHHVAERLGLKKGDSLVLGTETFRVARCMPAMGSADDIRVVGLLEDIQRVLGLEGRINEIKAIDCLCLTPNDKPQSILQSQLEKVLPEARVVMLSKIAEGRARIRQTYERYAPFIIGMALLFAATLVGLLAVVNVLGRVGEIGLLRALGYSSTTIGWLILARGIMVGLVGGLAGALIGTGLAMTYGPAIFQVTAGAIQPRWSLLAWSLLLAPLLTAIVSLIPAAIAISQDPADVLRQ